jgi:hypothetical protein
LTMRMTNTSKKRRMVLLSRMVGDERRGLKVYICGGRCNAERAGRKKRVKADLRPALSRGWFKYFVDVPPE